MSKKSRTFAAGICVRAFFVFLHARIAPLLMRCRSHQCAGNVLGKCYVKAIRV